jgi:urease accessory protein
MGQMEAYTHQATMVCLDEGIEPRKLIGMFSEELLKEEEIIFGISEAPVNGFILRMLGNKAEQLFDCLQRIAAQLDPVYH